MNDDFKLKPQTIAVVSAQAVEFTRKLYITDLEGVDITSDTINMSIGDESAPGSWIAPNRSGGVSISVASYTALGGRNPFQLPPSQLLYRRWAQLLVSATSGAGIVTPGVGSYWLWLQLGDSAETIPRRAFKLIVT